MKLVTVVIEILLYSAACRFRLGVASITGSQHNRTYNEHQIQHNVFDIINHDPGDVRKAKSPYFSNDNRAPTNITAIRESDAYLVCIVHNLGNNTISWLRHKDINLLSYGKFKYTQDPRYQIFHSRNNETWTLKIRRVRKEDEGKFECQISTTPHVSRVIYLKVIDPVISMREGGEKFAEVGSNVNFTCYIKHIAEQQHQKNFVKWQHNDQEINHFSPRGVLIITEHDVATISQLMIKNLTPADSGRYSCFTSAENRASIVLYVRDDSREFKTVSTASLGNIRQISMFTHTCCFLLLSANQHYILRLFRYLCIIPLLYNG